MRPVFIHFDDALIGQPALLADGAAAGAREIDARALGPRLRLWSTQATLDELERLLAEQLPLAEGPLLSFYGSGDFHHVAALLIARAAAMVGKPLTVIHIDNHPDWVRFRGGMHCGSWVGRAARLPDIDRVITIGPCSTDIDQGWRKGADLALIRDGQVELYPYGARGARDHAVRGVVRPTIAGLGEDAFLAMLADRIGTDHVYVTIDKDALSGWDAATNWDQGQLGLAFVATLLERLAAGWRIAGADVCGDWSAPAYDGSALTRLRKRAESWLDQPRHAPPPGTLAVNQRTNRALLAQFAAIAA